jgi:hypothetical protein
MRMTDPDAWLARITARIEQTPVEAQKLLLEAGKDMLARSIDGNLGAGVQPQGVGRLPWLAANMHPFARAHGSPLALIKPIGIISGDLLASIQMGYESGPFAGMASVRTFSAGVPYAKFIWAEDGTETMFAREFKQDMEQWSLERSKTLAREIAAYVRSTASRS